MSLTRFRIGSWRMAAKKPPSRSKPVDSRPFRLPLLRRHSAKRLQKLRDPPLLAERGHPLRFERGEIGRRGDAGDEVFVGRVFSHGRGL